jgi:hypothetical protein
VLINPLAERVKILCAGVVGDTVERSDAERVVGWDAHNAGLRVLVAFRRIPSLNQMIACRADVAKATNVHEHFVHVFT